MPFNSHHTNIRQIATKCDDISCDEIIRALQLDNDPELEEIQDRLDTLAQETKASKKEKRDAEKMIKGLSTTVSFTSNRTNFIVDSEKQLAGVREQLREDENHIEALENGETFVPTIKASKKYSKNGKKRKNTSGGKRGSPKRRRSVANSEDEDDEDISDESESDFEASDNDSGGNSDRSEEEYSDNEGHSDEDVDMDGPISIEELKERVKASKASIKMIREHLNKVRATKKAAIDALSSLEKNSVKAQREKNAFCSLKRSEVCNPKSFINNRPLEYFNNAVLSRCSQKRFPTRPKRLGW